MAEAKSKPNPSTHPNLKGGCWIIASAVCFTGSATIIKLLGARYSPLEQVFWAQVAAILILSPLMVSNFRHWVRPARARLLVMRSALSTVGIALTFYSYHELPLADANALSFTRTFWVFALAALILRERLRSLTILATVASFFGVLLIGGIDGESQWGWGIAAGLAAAIAAAVVAVTVRGISGDVDSLTMQIWGALLGLVFATPMVAIGGLQWPDRGDLWLLLLQGFFSVGQVACYLRGLHLGEASAVMPFDYSRLVFLLATGWLFFGEMVSVPRAAGMAIIVGASLLVLVDTLRNRAPKVAPRTVAVVNADDST